MGFPKGAAVVKCPPGLGVLWFLTTQIKPSPLRTTPSLFLPFKKFHCFTHQFGFHAGLCNLGYDFCVCVSPPLFKPNYAPTAAENLRVWEAGEGKFKRWHAIVFCVCVSISALQIGSSVPFFSKEDGMNWEIGIDICTLRIKQASLVAQWWTIPLPVQEMRVRSLGQEDPLEKEMATHSSILAWEIPWTEETGGLQSMGLQKSLTQIND